MHFNETMIYKTVVPNNVLAWLGLVLLAEGNT